MHFDTGNAGAPIDFSSPQNPASAHQTNNTVPFADYRKRYILARDNIRGGVADEFEDKTTEHKQMWQADFAGADGKGRARTW